MSPYLEQMAQLEEELYESQQDLMEQKNMVLSLRSELTKALEDNARLYKENKELKQNDEKNS